ncbi:MAG TPA: lamin tail domain-containing protein [Candidatus Saccharimonadales bacterium]
MRRINTIFQASGVALLLIGLVVFGLPRPTQADTATGPSLVISQLKITSSNGQFITLYNSSNTTVDMSKYQLEYFNSYDLTKASSSRLIALSGSVPPHGYFMVNDSSLLLCYQVTVDSISLGLSSTAGMVELLAFNQGSPGGSVLPVLQDYVSWSKTAAAGAQTLPSNVNALLERQPVDAQNNPQVGAPGAGSWQAVQPDGNNPCNIIGANSGTVLTGMSQLLPPSEPPASIVAASSGGVAAPTGVMPASDIGLMGPQITELLPNPTGTGNDATDEFIELYNPNPTTFDLSGFSLQSGITSFHSYVFPAGTTLPANGFTAFYSKDTGLGLSNTSGQVKLLDPLGNSISASGAYDTAKDGVSWALAQGKWYWTTNVTPGAANVIKEPATTKKAASAATSKGKKASTAKIAKKTIKKLKSSKASSFSDSGDDNMTPIHPWTLAIVGGLALLYGVYEYRTDLANRVYQLRRYLSARRADRT